MRNEQTRTVTEARKRDKRKRIEGKRPMKPQASGIAVRFAQLELVLLLLLVLLVLPVPIAGLMSLIG